MSAVDDARLRETTPTTFYEELVKLPGYGKPPNRCRDMTPIGFCDHGHVLLGRSSCGTRYCPDHWRDWLEDAVVSLVARLGAYRHARDGWEKRMCHVVASPPQSRRYSSRELWETRRDAYDALEAAGVRGGAVITHPYRTTLELDRLFQTADVEHGKWRFLRELVNDLESGGWDDVAEYIEPSPHYHALAAVEDVRGDEAPDGWIVENVRSFERFDFEDRESYEDMVRTAYYVLTHAGVEDGRSSTTYFGEIHPSAFSPEEELAPAVWRRIQREAEAAVRGHEPEEEEESDGVAGPDECPREECEAVVRDLESLPDRLDNEGWCRDVRLSQGGRERLAQLRGCLAWFENRTDRPPPSARRSEPQMLAWLRERGEAFTPEPSQVRIGELMG